MDCVAPATAIRMKGAKLEENASENAQAILATCLTPFHGSHKILAPLGQDQEYPSLVACSNGSCWWPGINNGHCAVIEENQ